MNEQHDEIIVRKHTELFAKIFDKLNSLPTRDDFHDIKKDLMNINDRLFKDNGVESFQSFRNRTNMFIEDHEKEHTNVVSFWYFLIPVVVSIVLIVIDKLWK